MQGISSFVETVASIQSAAGGGGGGLAGTLAWKAPESFADGRYSTASDVFGLGVTGFETATRSLPYLGLGQPAILHKASVSARRSFASVQQLV
jgi:serine/threonine protein kinase